MIVYLDILARLKKAGYSQNRIIREHILGASTLTNIRDGKSITTASIDVLCSLLQCQPGDLLRHQENAD